LFQQLLYLQLSIIVKFLFFIVIPMIFIYPCYITHCEVKKICLKEKQKIMFDINFAWTHAKRHATPPNTRTTFFQNPFSPFLWSLVIENLQRERPKKKEKLKQKPDAVCLYCPPLENGDAMQDGGWKMGIWGWVGSNYVWQRME